MCPQGSIHHSPNVEVRGQLVGLDFLLLPCEFKGWNSVVSLGAKCIYPLSYFAGPGKHYFLRGASPRNLLIHLGISEFTRTKRF